MPVSTTVIATTGLAAEIAAEAGGRLARLSWQRRSSGSMVDIIAPMTTGLAPPRWPKAGAYPIGVNFAKPASAAGVFGVDRGGGGPGEGWQQ